MIEKLFPYRQSDYINKAKKAFEVQWDPQEEVEAAIDFMIAGEKKDHRDMVLKNFRSGIEIFLWVAMLFVAISTLSIQKNIWSLSNDIQSQNLSANQTLTNNSAVQLELAKKQTIFQTLDVLNKSINQKDYDVVKGSLRNKQPVELKLLQSYLNNFENVYMACHRGLVPKDDVKYSFEYLLGHVCSNQVVVDSITNGYGGLKKLCGTFFPNSTLAGSANMSTNHCQ